MATKPNLSNHVSPLFELYSRIPRLGRITAVELKQQLTDIGVVRDIRTIQRNLDVMVQHLNVYKVRMIDLMVIIVQPYLLKHLAQERVCFSILLKDG